MGVGSLHGGCAQQARELGRTLGSSLQGWKQDRDTGGV